MASVSLSTHAGFDSGAGGVFWESRRRAALLRVIGSSLQEGDYVLRVSVSVQVQYLYMELKGSVTDRNRWHLSPTPLMRCLEISVFFFASLK